MMYRTIAILLLSMLTGLADLLAQTCDPKAYFSYTKEGTFVEKDELTAYSGSGPVTGYFEANASGYDGYTAEYTWHIYAADKNWDSYEVTRSTADFEFTFSQSGSFVVELRVNFRPGPTIVGGVDIPYPAEGDAACRFTVSVAESKLEMPNAFSPNDDGYNDIYRAKPTHQSIVEFKAVIFNRWGQRLYSWDDVNGSWDGTYNGRVVPDGVYFVNVVAKGADGIEYKIRKDVNVLTRKTENGTTTNN